MEDGPRGDDTHAHIFALATLSAPGAADSTPRPAPSLARRRRVVTARAAVATGLGGPPPLGRCSSASSSIMSVSTLSARRRRATSSWACNAECTACRSAANPAGWMPDSPQPSAVASTATAPPAPAARRRLTLAALPMRSVMAVPMVAHARGGESSAEGEVAAGPSTPWVSLPPPTALPRCWCISTSAAAGRGLAPVRAAPTPGTGSARPEALTP